MSNKKVKSNTETNLTEKQVIEVLQAYDEALNIRDNQIANGVFDVTAFSKGMAEAGAFTPYTQNEIMKRINIATNSAPDGKKIDEALSNPIDNESNLVNYGQSYYFSSLMYKRNQEYLANLPAFDLEISCINAKPEDYKTNKYKNDYEEIKKFINSFNYREQFKSIAWNIVMNETYFAMFRELGDKSVIQEFPAKYSMITGKWEYGLLYDIDMNWFLQGEVDINCYPDWVIKKYKEMFDGKKEKPYIPSNKINKRTGTFGLWTQTDPADGCWVFKFNPNHNLQVPFFSGMLPEMAVLPILRNLQVNQSMAAARKLLVSSIPYLNEKKAASVANQLAIDADTLGKFIGLATQGLEAAIKVLALPTEDIKGVEFKNTDSDTYETFMTLTSSLLSGGKVIFSTSENQNAIETQFSIDIDRMLIKSIYPQFENFLEYYANKHTKKFKWAFRFVGTNDKFDREARQDEAFKYADKGVVLPNKIASSLGMNKIELERELEEMNASDFIDKLRPMINIYTQGNVTAGSTPNNGAGRPQVKDGDLTNSGSETRDKGSNIEKGGNL